ncbi:tetratricopeptide repeat protein [Chryseobacterium pennipullorum]|uniref:Tetratricopeptide repeat protein n=1 Tax=Chryseobacterium pennipullorum TaxID=2258963 RepID=A0A3D9B3K7_9FLAO|nr:tetratricopeptide repeat protein [Chryseobacterium pennipullorum]REC48214.1 hypothetical protein DRF67_07715 [Chryseobacterium pennipullorum]
MTLTKSKYYFEALDYFPFNLSECMDALNYALSYEPEDSDSLCLMGRIYSEVLKDYETAKNFFNEALQNNMGNVNIPKYYIECLLNYEDYDEAEKLIGFAYTIKGIDKADILRCKALLCERKEEYSEALEHLKNAERFSYCKEMTATLKERERFIRKKMPKMEKEEKVI